MNCQEAGQSIFSYADGELAGEVEAQVAEHVKLCDECRRTVDEQRGLRSALRRGLDAVPVPPGIKDRVQKAVAVGGTVRGARSGAVRFHIRAVAAAACVVLAASLVWHYVPGPDPVVVAIAAKHHYCCGHHGTHQNAELPSELTGLATAITTHEENKFAAIAPDLSSFGFQFESANFCGLKDMNCRKGGHVIYVNSTAGHDERFSIFSVPRAPQLQHLEAPASSGNTIKPIRLASTQAGPAVCICVWCSGSTHYVCCGEVSPPELIQMAGDVRAALANPQTQAMFARLARGP